MLRRLGVAIESSNIVMFVHFTPIFFPVIHFLELVTSKLLYVLNAVELAPEFDNSCLFVPVPSYPKLVYLLAIFAPKLKSVILSRSE